MLYTYVNVCYLILVKAQMMFSMIQSTLDGNWHMPFTQLYMILPYNAGYMVHMNKQVFTE